MQWCRVLQAVYESSLEFSWLGVGIANFMAVGVLSWNGKLMEWSVTECELKWWTGMMIWNDEVGIVSWIDKLKWWDGMVSWWNDENSGSKDKMEWWVRVIRRNGSWNGELEWWVGIMNRNDDVDIVIWNGKLEWRVKVMSWNGEMEWWVDEVMRIPVEKTTWNGEF